MKKYLILLIIPFLLSGCSSVVNINIEKDIIKEKVQIKAKNITEYKEIKDWSGFPITLYIDQQLSNPWSDSGEKESGVPYYSTKFDDNSMTATVSGSFSLSNHKRSSIINECFQSYNIVSNDENTIFSTSKGVVCKFNNFDLIVKTPYLVVSNNANQVDKTNNTFTWNINDSNFDKVGIYLEIDFSSKYNENDIDYADSDVNITTDIDQNEENEGNNIILVIVSFICLSVILIGALILKKKKDYQNRI